MTNIKEEKLESELDFSKVLFLHINRILQCSGLDPNMFISEIESFSDTLYPYFDKDCEKKIEKAEIEFEERCRINPIIPNRDTLIFGARLDLSRRKFRILMQLAERKGLLLKKSDYGEDEDA